MVTDDYYDLVSMDAATANSAGLKADGSVVANGLDVSGLSNILAIDCTSNGLFALDAEGRVTTLAFSYAHLPDVSDWRNIVAISASATHVAGITASGKVLSRGASDMGQCNTQEWVLFTPTPTPSPSETPQTTPAP
jgi:alpha-tubulin suppressor-like RCC1 family protein